MNDIDVSGITDMSFLFNTSIFYEHGDKIHDGNKIFRNFNGDISRWDVSNVTDMKNMFDGCKNFNCDLSWWNVSNVTDMSFMFYECKNFNSDIS